MEEINRDEEMSSTRDEYQGADENGSCEVSAWSSCPRSRSRQQQQPSHSTILFRYLAEILFDSWPSWLMITNHGSTYNLIHTLHPVCLSQQRLSQSLEVQRVFPGRPCECQKVSTDPLASRQLTLWSLTSCSHRGPRHNIYKVIASAPAPVNASEILGLPCTITNMSGSLLPTGSGKPLDEREGCSCRKSTCLQGCSSASS